MNTVEVNFQAWAQLLIRHSLKLLGKSVDCTLERFMPLDLCFYCSGVWRFTVAVHPDTWICCKSKQSARCLLHETSTNFKNRSGREKEAVADRGVSLSLSLDHRSQLTTMCVSVSSAGLNWTIHFLISNYILHYSSSDCCGGHTVEKATAAAVYLK